VTSQHGSSSPSTSLSPSSPSSPPQEGRAVDADPPPARTKIPESVLVVIHTVDGQVLLLERADHPGYWQSVTGSKDHVDEPLTETCRREVLEETGLDTRRFALEDWQTVNRYEIYRHWRSRYPEGVTHNTEHVFGLRLPAIEPVRVAPREHLQFQWLPWQEAAARCFSWSNVQAIQQLATRLAS
jgi:dATP pyrophosphohydrolase